MEEITAPVKRKAGRPKGAVTKVKISDAMKLADKHSVKAMQVLIDIMEGRRKGSTAQNEMQCATKVLEAALKLKEMEELEKRSKEESKATAKAASKEASKQEEEKPRPLIQLHAN